MPFKADSKYKTALGNFLFFEKKNEADPEPSIKTFEDLTKLTPEHILFKVFDL
jgi:hypothetical protein